ncbi:MAG: helix-turn-helix domain-containing protein [Geminicoccaceae bacterium]
MKDYAKGATAPGFQTPSNGIAGRLLQLRKDAGLTLAETGRRAGCKPTTVHACENGKQRPSARITAGLARAYDCPVEWIVEGRSQDAIAPFTSRFCRLSGRDKEIITATMEAMLRESGDG